MSIFGKIRDAIFGKARAATPARPPVGTTTRGADKLNWRTSIVDLMKLIGLDASYAERKELAQELGRSDYEGSAEDNIWLHRQVMNKLAANGGKVPASLRD